ncbi:MAG: DUF805 domain-containing protein [Spirochaetaceae bacterium]|nr:DUF805 domain-containing protein [Spirochaetaceae bacterium]
MGWYFSVLKKYAVFSGRARRKEFWMFFLFNFLIGIVLGILSKIPAVGTVIYGLSVLYSLAVLIPGLAVSVRRLHDTNRSGFFLFFALIPLVGAIILIVFAAKEGTSGNNNYGPNPKA